MAGLEGLASAIYHEKQQDGSMLCAQHALNSLLQGPYFTELDLSEIARKLDWLEEQYNTDDRRGGSKNMDDTGFFSVQVIEEALEVWGLNLIRWRSNVMRPYQDHPHTQLAFILNMGEHWFTLRRFGPALANIDNDIGKGHWFNLNSFLSAPEWVGKLYLGMVLQQAETEGYSVFVVKQSNTSQPLALSRTEADEIAATLPEPQSTTLPDIFGTRHDEASSRSTVRASGSGSQLERSEDNDYTERAEDEDYELQAALQASLTSQEGYGSSYSNIPSSSTLNGTNSRPSRQHHEHDSAGPDPVAASMERNRVLLQRMREQQEFAQRELWSVNRLDPEQQATQDAQRQARLRQEEEEAEQFRKAVAESEVMARQWDERQKDNSQRAQIQNLTSAERNDDTPVPSADYSLSEYRYHDDEDAELQAALRASLENVSPGRQQQIPQSLQPKLLESMTQCAPVISNKRTAKNMDVDEDENEAWHSEFEGSSSSGNMGLSTAEPGTHLSLDKIRQARLARFDS